MGFLSDKELQNRPERAERVLFAFGMLVLAAISSWLFLWNLGASSISGASDEVIYVRVVQGILHGDHVFPLYHGNNPTFEKPPLKLWLSAVFPWLLGESNLSFRLLDGLLGIVCVLLTVLLAYRLFGSRLGAVCVGFLVLVAPEWLLFQHSFRTVVLDGLLTALSLGIALAGLSLGQRMSRSAPFAVPLWSLSFLGSLAVLTKSVGGLVPVACAVCALCVSGMARGRYKKLWPLVLPALVLALYVGAVALVGGYPAVKVFIGVEIFDRVMSGFSGHNTGDRWYYLRYVFHRGGLAPAYLLIAGLLGSLVAAREDLRFRFLLPWVLLPIGLYSLSSSRVPWYLSPFVPFASMVAIFGVVWTVKHAKSHLVRTCLVVVVLMLAIPPYARALNRAVRYVSKSVERLEIDLLIEHITAHHDSFVIVGNALSGRSNPVRGRFNVEGIYREMLKPNLVAVKTPQEIPHNGRYVAFLKEEHIPFMPPGGAIVANLKPNGVRQYPVVLMEYNHAQ